MTYPALFRLHAGLRLALIGTVFLPAATAPAFAQDSFPSASSVPPEPFVTFFPPLPTIYGAPIPAPPTGTLRMSGRNVTTPDELADFVGENFYPMLGTRLFDGSLTKKMEARLAAYGATRATLLNELESELQRLQTEEPAGRTRELQAFALRQTPRVLALERDAEQLRRELAKGALFKSSVEWDSIRLWRLGDPSLANSPLKAEAEFQVARAYAYFGHGLGVEQRGLLRELAIDLAQTARAARRRPPPADANFAVFYFSPETARMPQLPAKLPSELIAKIARYNGDKSALKRELLATLNEVDPWSPAKRGKHLTALTERQWPRIVELEHLAEEIRAGLAAVPAIPPPWLPRLDADLRQRMESYNADRTKLIDELNAALAAARIQTVRPWEVFTLPADQRANVMRERTERAAAERGKVTREFQDRHAERIAELIRRYETIHADLALTALGLTHPQTGQPMTVETLLAAYNVANQRFDEIGREEVIYSRYKVAMLQPGLSPAQRRLLFGAAHAGLAQGLPTGEGATYPSRMPTTKS